MTTNNKIKQNSLVTELTAFEIGHCGYDYINTQRRGRYSLTTASGDLIDNSLDAEADKVWVLTEGPFKKIERLIFIDNGFGMNYDVLKGSYTLGFQRERLDSQNGKFGVGGTLGCLGIAGEKITLTRDEYQGDILCRQYRIQDIEKNDAWGTTVDRDWET